MKEISILCAHSTNKQGKGFLTIFPEHKQNQNEDISLGIDFTKSSTSLIKTYLNMCAWKLRCTQSFLGFISWPAPRNAKYKSRLIPCSSRCCNPITIIPSSVDSLTRIEKIKFNNLHLKDG